MIDFLNITARTFLQLVAGTILVTVMTLILWKVGYWVYRYGLYVVAGILSVMVYSLTKILKALKFAGRKLVKVADNLPTL